MKRLVLLHVLGNAALIGIVYWWLGLGDANAGQLLLTVVMGLAAILAGLWLHAGSFAWFRDNQPSKLAPAFRSTLRKLPAFAVAALGVLLVYLLIQWIESLLYPAATTFASWLTFHLRKPVRPLWMIRGLQGIFWALRWLILPAFVLPLLSAIAGHGWRGFRYLKNSRMQTLPRYFWLKCAVLTLTAFYVPDLIIHWVPRVKGISMETFSFATRFLAAYFLLVASWLLLVFISSGGRPRVIQPTTTSLP
jgi:hypothetical protein